MKKKIIKKTFKALKIIALTIGLYLGFVFVWGFTSLLHAEPLVEETEVEETEFETIEEELEYTEQELLYTQIALRNCTMHKNSIVNTSRQLISSYTRQYSSPSKGFSDFSLASPIPDIEDQGLSYYEYRQARNEERGRNATKNNNKKVRDWR